MTPRAPELLFRTRDVLIEPSVARLLSLSWAPATAGAPSAAAADKAPSTAARREIKGAGGGGGGWRRITTVPSIWRIAGACQGTPPSGAIDRRVRLRASVSAVSRRCQVGGSSAGRVYGHFMRSTSAASIAAFLFLVVTVGCSSSSSPDTSRLQR